MSMERLGMYTVFDLGGGDLETITEPNYCRALIYQSAGMCLLCSLALENALSNSHSNCFDHMDVMEPAARLLYESYNATVTAMNRLEELE